MTHSLTRSSRLLTLSASTKKSPLTIRGALVLHQLSAYLPVSWLRRLGESIGRRALKRARRRQAIALANLKLCFPELTETAQLHLLDAHGAALGRGIAESAIAWYASDAKIQQLVKVTGTEYLSDAKKLGRGVLLVCGHFTTLELSVRSLGQVTQFTGVWRPLGEPATDRRTRRGRLRAATDLVEKASFRPALKTLRDGGVVAIAIDQADSTESAVIAPFFGHPASSIDTPARLARHRGCVVLPFATRAEGDHYLTEIGPPIAGLDTLSPESAATSINQLIEQQVQQSPAEYYWVHRRFKHTLPDIYEN